MNVLNCIQLQTTDLTYITLFVFLIYELFLSLKFLVKKYTQAQYSYTKGGRLRLDDLLRDGKTLVVYVYIDIASICFEYKSAFVLTTT